MDSLRAAAVQFNHAPGDKAYNLGRIKAFASEAHVKGVDLLVFPEMCITGYWHVRKLSRQAIEALAEPVPGGESTQALLALASAYGMTIGAGLIECADDGMLYNTYVVALPDGNVVQHRKLHCFISAHMVSGSEYTVFDIPQGARVGVLTCYDNNIGENVRITALQGAEVLLAPHQTGGCVTRSPYAMGRIDRALWERRDEDPETIQAVKERLRKGGLFITDNLLWSGRILESQPEEASTRGILEFTKRLYADPDFLTSIIPIRDGLAVAVKL